MIDERAYLVLETINMLRGARFSELLRQIGNPRTLSQKLSYLRELDMIKLQGERYRLTAKGVEVFEALSKALDALGKRGGVASNVERLPNAFLAPVLARYVDILYGHFKQTLLGVQVFGSLARGTWTKDSDVDVLLVVDGWKAPLWERLRELWYLRNILRKSREFREAMEKGYVPILQHYPLSEIEARTFHRVYLDAAIEGIILYEKDGFLSDLMNTVKVKLRDSGAKRILIPAKGHYWILGNMDWFEAL